MTNEKNFLYVTFLFLEALGSKFLSDFNLDNIPYIRRAIFTLDPLFCMSLLPKMVENLLLEKVNLDNRRNVRNRRITSTNVKNLQVMTKQSYTYNKGQYEGENRLTPQQSS